MTESMTQSFVISTEDKAIIQARVDELRKITKGDVSESAALRSIIREWAERNAKQQPTSPTPTEQN